MKLHGNAKSTPSSRLLLVRRVLFEGWSYPTAAAGAGVSVRTVAKWVKRFRIGGVAGLEDGSSKPGAPAHQTPPWAVTLIQWLREQRISSPHPVVASAESFQMTVDCAEIVVRRRATA